MAKKKDERQRMINKTENKILNKPNPTKIWNGMQFLLPY
jgi:hypothetical protein